MQRHCFCKSSIGELLIILNMHNNEHPLSSNTKGYGCKTHQTASQDSDTIAQWQKAVLLAVLGLTTELGNYWISFHICFCGLYVHACTCECKSVLYARQV
jgi:hypothetical protein